VSRGVEQPRGMKSLAAGLAGTATLETVGPADLASALGSGDLPVLGTPRVVALLEAAAVAALDGALAPQATSVGVAVRIRHLAPSVEGAAIRATATLVGVEGRRLLFRVEAADAVGSVADGEHERVVVERAAFLERARQRAGGIRPPGGTG